MSKSAPKKSTGPKKTSLRPSSKATAKNTSAKKRRYRKEPFRYRLARLKLQPERVQEIQQALVAQGYMSQEPNGKWDDTTRSAMRRFQQELGFPPTGMPEAKSLMKLGLGPHPLPEDLDPTAQARPPAGPLGGPTDAATPLNSHASPIPQQ